MYEDEEIITFTLSEARSLIPKLRKMLARVTSERDALVGMRAEIEKAREQAENNGGSPVGPAYLAHLISFSESVQEIQSLGVQIKDFDKGLVDFPYEMEGRVVYLCWKLDEDDISWWHEIEAGFAGRKLLTDDFD